MRFTWRCSTRRVEAIYLNDSFVRSLEAKAQPIRNITGRAHRHYDGRQGFDSFVPSGLMLLTPRCPTVVVALWGDYIRLRRAPRIHIGSMPKNGRKKRERARWPMVKKRSKLAKSSDRAQRTLFFSPYLRFLASFRRSRDFIRHQPVVWLWQNVCNRVIDAVKWRGFHNCTMTHKWKVIYTEKLFNEPN